MPSLSVDQNRFSVISSLSILSINRDLDQDLLSLFLGGSVSLPMIHRDAPM